MLEEKNVSLWSCSIQRFSFLFIAQISTIFLPSVENSVFFDLERAMLYEHLWASRTVNKHYWFSVLKRLRDSVRRKRPDKSSKNCWIFHEYSPPSHRSSSKYHRASRVFLVPQVEVADSWEEILVERGDQRECDDGAKGHLFVELPVHEGGGQALASITSDELYFEGDKINSLKFNSILFYWKISGTFCS